MTKRTPKPEVEPNPLPDAALEQFTQSAKLVLEAAWAVSDCSRQADPSNPKSSFYESLKCLQQSVVAAVSADGVDAVIGYALVAQSLARKAIYLRQTGSFVGDDDRPQAPPGLPPGLRELFGG